MRPFERGTWDVGRWTWDAGRGFELTGWIKKYYGIELKKAEIGMILSL